MLILLSCAKTMTSNNNIEPPFVTTAKYEQNAKEIIKQISTYSIGEIEALLKVNYNIAEENHIRYQNFTNQASQTPALLAYDGIVFKYIDPSTFSKEDFEYAQDHLRIVSFAYGLLRPMDKINNYRLEGNFILPQTGKSVFKYWQSKLTDQLISDTKAVGGILCNLASKEMQSMFDWKRVKKELKVISPEFKVWKDGKLKTIVIYTKIARGQATREIIKNKISDTGALNKLINNILDIK